MTASLFPFLSSDDVFAPSDLADTPESFRAALKAEPHRSEKPHPVSPGRKLDRNTLIAAMVDEGETYAVIATAFGISRERVRQVYCKTRGVARKPRGETRGVMAFVSAVRADPAVDSWEDAYRVSGYRYRNSRTTGLMRSLAALGLDKSLVRLFRLRVRAVRRRKVVAALRSFAAKAGRTARVTDFYVGGHGTDLTAIYREFGSFPAALRAAGFEPNRRENRRRA
jgi:hypothetical protein